MKTADGPPVRGMPMLLADLGKPALNEVELPATPERPLTKASRQTKLQERAFGLLGIDSSKTVAMQLAGRKGGIRAIPPAVAGVFLNSIG
ncbi:MAG: hypothetical protein OXI87_01785 [Albidovulum sp.]|nr:hypothetical protein [Albidovulum sp.]MDE0303604.1 hypothetical protein [Albidovulum sp.]